MCDYPEFQMKKYDETQYSKEFWMICLDDKPLNGKPLTEGQAEFVLDYLNSIRLSILMNQEEKEMNDEWNDEG